MTPRFGPAVAESELSVGPDDKAGTAVAVFGLESTAPCDGPSRFGKALSPEATGVSDVLWRWRCFVGVADASAFLGASAFWGASPGFAAIESAVIGGFEASRVCTSASGFDDCTGSI